MECLPVAPVKELKGTRLLASVYRSSPHLPRTTVLDELNLEKKGPYIGRKGAAFKGKMWERKMGARQEELRVALLKTDAKEAAWRKVSSPLSRREGDNADVPYFTCRLRLRRKSRLDHLCRSSIAIGLVQVYPDMLYTISEKR